MSAFDGQEPGLHRLADLASEFGSERVALTTRLIADRVSEGRFYVACVGQFKRGKSTLLNALVGQAILPAGVIPVTSVPTILRYDALPSIRLRLSGSDWKSISTSEIEDYVSENKNPENVKGIVAMEIFLPVPLLRTGMCLVDTPGLGSVFAGNTKATKDFIPQMDAALVVLGVDPPISGEELDLVERVACDVPQMLFVLNKADRASEEDRSAAVNFARRVLETRLRRTIPEIFEVSSLEHLESHGPDRDWPKLAQALERLMQESGRELVQSAAGRAAQRTAAYICAAIEEDRRALRHPLERSESRVNDLRITLEKAGETMQDLGALLSAEQQRFSRTFADRRRLFLDQARSAARDEMRGLFSSVTHFRSGPAYRREIMHLAQEIARAALLPWLEGEERFAGDEFQRTIRRFVGLGNDFLRRMSGMGLACAVDFPQEVDSELNLRSKSRFHFHVIERIAAPASPLLFISDMVCGVLGVRQGIQHDAAEFLDQLLDINSARVQSDVEERVRESRKKFENEIKTVLRDVLDMAEHALVRARAAQVSGAATVQASLARLDETEGQVKRIVEYFAGNRGQLSDAPASESSGRDGVRWSD